jgi:hypothetical protein
MELYLLNIEQKELIEGKEFAKDSFFNPIQDKNGDWFVSQEEVRQCENKEFEFIKNLPLTTYEPIIYEANE